MATFDINALMGNPLFQVGLGLLQAGGPQRQPVGWGQGLAQGLQNWQQAQQFQTQQDDARQQQQWRQLQLQSAQQELGRQQQLRTLQQRFLRPDGALGYGTGLRGEQARLLLDQGGESADFQQDPGGGTADFQQANLAAINDGLNSVAPDGQAEPVRSGPDLPGYLASALGQGLIDPQDYLKWVSQSRRQVKEFADLVDPASGQRVKVPLYDTGEAGAPLPYQVPSTVKGVADTGDALVAYDETGQPMQQFAKGWAPGQAEKLDIEQGQLDVARANAERANQELQLTTQRFLAEQQQQGFANNVTLENLKLAQQNAARAQQELGLRQQMAQQKAQTGPQAAGRAGLDAIRAGQRLFFDDQGEFRLALAAAANVGGKGLPGWGEARQARSNLEQAIQAYALQVTGTTFTDQQMESLRNTFLPGIGDTTASARDKFQRLEAFLLRLASTGNAADPGTGKGTGTGTGTGSGAAVRYRNPKTGQVVEWNGRAWVPAR